MMIRYVIIAGCFVGLSAPASLAQDNAAPWEPPMQENAPSDEADPLGQGLDGFMDNLMRDLAPELDKLGENMFGTLSDMAPVLQDLAVLGEDLGNYQTPERLENGDILIRRKADAPPPPPIGDNLREFTTPDDPSGEAPKDRIPELIQRDPDRPEYEL